MEYNLERSGIGCYDDQLGNGSVQSFGSLIGSFFDLLKACTLNDKVVNFGCQFLGGEWLSSL